MFRSPCGGGLQGERTALLGKTPSNMTCNAGDEPRVSMDGADKSSAPSIPGPGCAPRQSSSYGRCFARSRPPMIPAVLQFCNSPFPSTSVEYVLCMALQQGLPVKVDCRMVIDCHRTRHCGSRGQAQPRTGNRHCKCRLDRQALQFFVDRVEKSKPVKRTAD